MLKAQMLEAGICNAEAARLRATRIGVALVALKRMIRHGAWKRFVREAFPGMSPRTAQKYMAKARG